MGCHPLYTDQKKIRIVGNQNQTPLLDRLRGQYPMISKYQETGMQVKEKIREGNCEMSETCSANVDKLKKTTATLV